MNVLRDINRTKDRIDTLVIGHPSLQMPIDDAEQRRRDGGGTRWPHPVTLGGLIRTVAAGYATELPARKPWWHRETPEEQAIRAKRVADVAAGLRTLEWLAELDAVSFKAGFMGAGQGASEVGRSLTQFEGRRDGVDGPVVTCDFEYYSDKGTTRMADHVNVRSHADQVVPANMADVAHRIAAAAFVSTRTGAY